LRRTRAWSAGVKAHSKARLRPPSTALKTSASS
jgi:hypothetical protein